MKKMSIITCLAVFLYYCVPVSADIATDGSMGSPAQVLSGPNYAIGEALGKRAGNNLFHSFSEFNINTGETATFTGTEPIEKDLDTSLSLIVRPNELEILIEPRSPNI